MAGPIEEVNKLAMQMAQLHIRLQVELRGIAIIADQAIRADSDRAQSALAKTGRLISEAVEQIGRAMPGD